MRYTFFFILNSGFRLRELEMIVELSCPSCSKLHQIENPYSGTVITCSACGTYVVIALPQSLQKEAEQKEFRFSIHSGRKKKTPVSEVVLSPEQRSHLRERSFFILSRWLDVPKKDLEEAFEMVAKGEAYDEFSIPKGTSHRFRQICAPKESLKLIQRRVLDRLLYRIPVSNACHGFMPGRSIVTNAEFHLPTAQVVYNVDLKDAFPTVDSQWVKHLLVRYLKIPLKHLGETVEHEALDEIIFLLTKYLTHNNCLPQGSPASGCLLNVASIKLDKYIYKLLSEEGLQIRYSRYADDLTFSSQEEISQDFRQKIIKTIRKCGFHANTSKIEYRDRRKNEVLEVTGLILEKGAVRIPKDTLERYRTIIHQAYQAPTESITDEKRLEIQSVVAFVSMVYKFLPYRIVKPYKQFLEKHGGKAIGESKKLSLTQYPKS